MNYDQNRVRESKTEYRAKLAKKPIAEKLELLEEIVERSLATRKDTSKVLPDCPWEIPANWKWRTMGDVAQIVGGGTPKTSNPQNFGGNIPWITPADLSKYTVKTIAHGSRNITPEGLKGSGARLLPKDTVLFSSRAPIGYVAIAANEVATNQGFKSFVLKQNLLPDYVYHYLHRARNLANDLASGTTFLEISGKNAARLPIPVPPLTEQRRIVARIEELFSRLDAGVAALRHAKAQLQRYRQSVLAAAVTGQLTQAWREQHPDTETATELLDRILDQRREQWNGRGIYSEPLPPTGDQIRPLPPSWASTSVDAIALIGSGNTPSGLKQHEGSQEGDLPWFKVGDMNREGNEVRMVVAETILPAKVAKKYGLKVFPTGTIIFPKRGGAILTGKKRILSEESCLDATTLGLTVSPEIASYFWTWFLQIRLASLSDGSNVPQVNNKDILPLWVPLPPLAEQHQIVAKVEARTTAIDHLEAELDRQITRSNRLRQSTLASAFSGKLSS